MARADDDSWDLASGVGATATAVAASRALANRAGLIDDAWAEPLVRAVGMEHFQELLMRRALMPRKPKTVPDERKYTKQISKQEWERAIDFAREGEHNPVHEYNPLSQAPTVPNSDFPKRLGERAKVPRNPTPSITTDARTENRSDTRANSRRSARRGWTDCARARTFYPT